MTHFATADDDPEFMRAQLEAFATFVARLRARWPELTVHAANSAATLHERGDPLRDGPLRDRDLRLRSDAATIPPPIGWSRRSSSARTSPRSSRRGRATAPGTAAGSSPTRETWIATVPIGYADGVRAGADQQLRRADRRAPLSAGRDGQHGQRHGRPRSRAAQVAVGDEATLIGRDGAERQTAEDLAGADRDDQLRDPHRHLAAGARGPTTATGARHERRPDRRAGARSPAAAGWSAAPSAIGCCSGPTGDFDVASTAPSSRPPARWPSTPGRSRSSCRRGSGPGG